MVSKSKNKTPIADAALIHPLHLSVCTLLYESHPMPAKWRKEDHLLQPGG
jgi:hypothetical protein